MNGPIAVLSLFLVLLAAACGATHSSGESQETVPPTPQDLQPVTILPRDAIPAIDNPQFYGTESAIREYEPDEDVIGVALDGQAKAYSVGLLSRHEIVNDMLAGRPIAVTW